MLNQEIRKEELLISSSIVLAIFLLSALGLAVSLPLSSTPKEVHLSVSISLFIAFVGLVFFLISLTMKKTEAPVYSPSYLFISTVGYAGYVFASYIVAFNLLSYSHSVGIGGFFILFLPFLLVGAFFSLSVILNICAIIFIVLDSYKKSNILALFGYSPIHLFGLLISIAACVWCWNNNIPRL